MNIILSTHTHTLTHTSLTHTSLTHTHAHTHTHTHTHHSLTHHSLTHTHTHHSLTHTHTHTHTHSHTHTHTHTHTHAHTHTEGFRQFPPVLSLGLYSGGSCGSGTQVGEVVEGESCQKHCSHHPSTQNTRHLATIISFSCSIILFYC